MPKRVDHEERRAQIAEALIQVAGRRGLHAVGMRDVAAEAGVSLRLVQYYFETKEKLLFYGLQHLTDRFTARVGARLAAAGAGAGPPPPGGGRGRGPPPPPRAPPRPPAVNRLNAPVGVPPG
ncbi:TetR/AcrR family transcriptional regulator, partial [Streptomyces sp. NPDC000656]|uniref:TetR/AcrR family transcriptional regulator n=1 Tax=Streptomyces sp. NPDC000656 TaxID=3364540 RepID=UPI003687F3FD